MKHSLDYIISKSIEKILAEAPARETNNATSDAVDDLFTPAEQKFLGKFDARGTNHLGVIYSLTDEGIGEFCVRSGADLNLTPEMLTNFVQNGIIKYVPYGGFGRNNNWTLELQLSLDDVKGYGDEERKNIESGTSGGGGGAAPAETPPMPEPTAPPNESFTKNKPLITEQAKPDTKQRYRFVMLDRGFRFWEKIYDAISSYDWDEAIIKSEIGKITSKEYAIFVDLAGLILSKQHDPKFISDSLYKYIETNVPSISFPVADFNTIQKFHRLSDFFNQSKVSSWLDWGENLKNGRVALFDKLRNSGIGTVKYKITAGQITVTQLYTTYTTNDVVNVFNRFKIASGLDKTKTTAGSTLTPEQKQYKIQQASKNIIKDNIKSWYSDVELPTDILQYPFFKKAVGNVDDKGNAYVYVENYIEPIAPNVAMSYKNFRLYSNGFAYFTDKKIWRRFWFEKWDKVFKEEQEEWPRLHISISTSDI